jgi:hypothetical protein
MFALSFTSLALARIQQAKEIKQERKSDGKSTKKSLVPDIARRGFPVLAILLTLAVSSAQAKEPIGGAAGAGLYRGPTAPGFEHKAARQTESIHRDAPVASNFPKTDGSAFKSSNLTSKPISMPRGDQTKMLDKVDGNSGPARVARHVDTNKKSDSSKILDRDKPCENCKKLDGAKPLDLDRNLNVGKNLKAGKELNVGKNISKPNGNTGVVSRNIANASKRSVNAKLVGAIKAGKLDPLTNGAAARKLGMGEQFKLMDKGDIARRMKLTDKLEKNGGWKKRMCGPIDPHYCDHCKGQFYCGPKWCPGHCWCPRWCGWVEWCFESPMWFDPRPSFCEPVECVEYEVEEAVVVNRDGTPDSWVDDQPPQAAEDAAEVDVDLELVAIRFVDNGNAEKNIGPRYRVLIRNNGKQAIDHPFNVAAVLGAAEESSERTPRAGKRVPGIDAGQTLAVDIRLPAEANAAVKNDEGHSVAKFPKLGVMVDTRNEVEEPNKENNGMALSRDEILMVDPAIFAADTKQATLGQTIKLAGEGLGPEAGQVLVRVGGLELQAEIEGWYDLGVEIKLPSLPLAGEAKAELVVVRGDDAAANPITLMLAGTQSAPPAAPEE